MEKKAETEMIRKVEKVNQTQQTRNLPEKEKKESWTNGEKFKMMFAREMRLEGDLKKS